MVDGHLFDTLSSIARRLHKTERPFGGIQVRLNRPRTRGFNQRHMLPSWSLQAIFSNCLQSLERISNHSSLLKVRSGKSASNIQSPSHTYFGRKITVRHSLSLTLVRYLTLRCSVRRHTQFIKNGYCFTEGHRNIRWAEATTSHDQWNWPN
jgi:hypothetical protein